MSDQHIFPDYNSTEISPLLDHPRATISPSSKRNDPAHHMAELRGIATARGGKVISEEYISSSTKMEFEDAEGRRWWARPNSIKRGGWSPFERSDPAPHMAELRGIATARGGKVVSEVYVSSTTKMEFEDAEGRRWWTTPAHIKSGHWSPFALFDPTPHMAELRRIAATHNGRVISEKYEGARIKMEFADQEGNRWWAIPDSIKSGHWSPYEARRKRKK